MSNSVIGALRVNLGLDSAQFTQGMKQAKKTTSDFQAVMGRLKGALAGLSAALSVGALTGMISQTMGAIDAQAKLARGIGGTTAAVQSLERAASRAGVAQSELMAAATRLNQRLGEAIETGKGTSGVFRVLGISAQELARMDVDERFAAISDAMRRAGANTQQMAFYLRELGIRQSSVINLMQEGGDAIRRSRQAVQDFGVALSDVDAAKVEAANDALSDVGRLFEGIRNQLSVALAPRIQSFAEAITDAARGTEGFRSAIQGIAAQLERAMTYAGVAAAAIGTKLVASMVAARFATLTLAGSLGLLRGALIRTGVGALVVAAGEAVYQFSRLSSEAGGFGNAMALLGDVVRETWDRVILGGLALIEGLGHVFKRIKAGWLGMVREMQSAWANFLDSAAGNVSAVRFLPGMDEAFAALRGAAIATRSAMYETEMAIRDANDAADAHAERSRELAAAMRAPLASVQALRDAMAAAAGATDGTADAADRFNASMGRLATETEGGAGRASSALNRLMEEGRRVFEATRTPAERLAMEIERLNRLMQAGAIDADTYARAVAQAQDAFDQAAQKSAGLGDTLQRSLGDVFASIVTGTPDATDALRGLAQQLTRMLANRAFEMLLGPGGALGGLFGGVQFGGARAAGGPVSAGRAYLVGERGPEMIVPRSAGQVIPNHALGVGSVTVQPVFQVVNNASGMVNVRQEQDGNVLRAVIDAVGAGLSADAAAGRGPLKDVFRRDPGTMRG